MSNHDHILRRGNDACLSDLTIDRLRLGECRSAGENETVTAHLRACERCRDRLREIEAVVAPTLDFGMTGAEAVGPRGKRKRLLWAIGLPAFAAAALVLVGSLHGPGERRKGGGWQLGVIVQDPDGRARGVSAGSVLAPGDRVRFEVSAPEDAFVSVISLDARGAVTPFVPATGDALPVRAGPRRLLAGAVRLDDSLGPERLLLVACPNRIAVATVVQAARAALGQAQGRVDQIGPLDLSCPQTSFWIRKEPRP